MSDIPDKSDPDSPQSQAERRSRMKLELNNLIEDLIQEGMANGLFDDLPGRGKPLRVQHNPHAPDLDLAHQLLKDNEMAPAWITDRKTLLAQKEALRARFKREWAQAQAAFARDAAGQDGVAIRWYDRCQAWDEEIRVLNKKIDDFNLKRPFDHLEIYKLVLDEELRRIGATRWLRP